MAYYGGGKGYGGPTEFRQPVENRVYVGNLAWGVTWKDLKDHMRQAGQVSFADVMVEAETGRSRGCGIVAYRTAEEAERAVQELHDTELMGRKIFVREDREAGGKGSAKQDCRVYVGNLAWSCTWKDLKDHFQENIGEVARADVLCEGGTEGGRSKGYGIVEFRSQDQAQQAIKTMTDTEIHGRPIFVREDRETVRPQQAAFGSWGGAYGGGPYKGGGGGKGGYGYGGKGYWESTGFAKVFVGNLPFEVTWQQLKDHMRPVGDIVHAEIMTEGADPAGRSKGCGIVEFATFGAARRAVERLHDSMLGGRMILVREYFDESGESGGGGGKGGKGGGKGKGGKGGFKVRVANLAEGSTWQVLKDHMRSAGDVQHVAVTPAGGIVTFSSAADAKRAVETLHKSLLEGQTILVERESA